MQNMIKWSAVLGLASLLTACGGAAPDSLEDSSASLSFTSINLEVDGQTTQEAQVPLEDGRRFAIQWDVSADAVLEMYTISLNRYLQGGTKTSLLKRGCTTSEPLAVLYRCGRSAEISCIVKGDEVACTATGAGRELVSFGVTESMSFELEACVLDVSMNEICDVRQIALTLTPADREFNVEDYLPPAMPEMG